MTTEPDSVLRTPRARQLGRIGSELLKGGLMPEELADQARQALMVWAETDYVDDLGQGVKRRLKVIDEDDDHVDVEVTLTGHGEPEHVYRLTLTVQEIEGPR